MKVKVSKSHWVRFISFIAVITGIAAFQFKDIRLTRSEYACQDFVMKLRCKNSEVLNIKGADFGREEDSICKSSRDHQSDETCSLVDKTNTVKTRCDGQPECFILASIHIFGNPCPGLKNYLNVMYVCVKQQHTAAPEGTSNTNVHIRMMGSVYACQSKTIKLKCERAKVLEIGAADYGRGEDSICKKDRKSDEACKLVDKTDTVKSLCNNRRRCKMKVSSSIFGDLCAGLNPYLNIMYVCVQSRRTLTSATTRTTTLTEGTTAYTEGSTATQSVLHGPKTTIGPHAKFQPISEGIKTAQSSNIDSPTPAQIKQSSTAEPSSTAITADVPTSSVNSWTTIQLFVLRCELFH
ncbi:PREDICTED: L-rhamnose-binding lectin CSL3-like [Acropora digitifera]|uniref:L-rhamnose-binding lectin CSL3-like n=1 Tax=Acropora digitifera TaxID=70779 RepID=UPI00077A9D7E|nr:PREDICTED: L-rhamnose-binding lectin CSL3-like [Acropora digitifera]